MAGLAVSVKVHVESGLAVALSSRSVVEGIGLAAEALVIAVSRTGAASRIAANASGHTLVVIGAGIAVALVA